MYDFAIGLLVILVAVVVYAHLDERRARRTAARAAQPDSTPADFDHHTVHKGRIPLGPLDVLGGQ